MQLQCTGGFLGISRYFNSTSSILTLLHISKPRLVQGLSTRVANHMRAWTHTCKNGGYRYFMRLYLTVISNSMKMLEYWHKYPTLKLSSILVHIIKRIILSNS